MIDLADGSTTPVSDPPIGTRPYPFVALAEQRLLVFGGNDGRADGAYYDLTEESWTVIPEVPSGHVAPNVRYFRRVGEDLVAVDTPWIRDTPLTAAVWRDGWKPATDPGAPARGFTATATTNEAIYLVGGSSMRTPEPGEEPDGDPSEDGSNGPYIIDTHHTIIRFTPTR